MTTDTLPSNNKANTSPLKHTIHFIAVFLRILQWKELQEVFIRIIMSCVSLFYSERILFTRGICLTSYHKDLSLLLCSGNQESIAPLSCIILRLTHCGFIRNTRYSRMDNSNNKPTTSKDRYYLSRLLSEIRIDDLSMVSSQSFFAVSCLVMLFNAGWLAFLLQFDLALVFCCSVQLVMCLYSPWFYAIETASGRIVSSR